MVFYYTDKVTINPIRIEQMEFGLTKLITVPNGSALLTVSITHRVAILV